MSAEGESPATPESVGATGPYHTLRIARVVRETADASSFVLEVPEALRERFAYRAGQFLTFRIEVDGERLVRCYSLASSPDVGEEPRVTVKRIEDGRVSNWMNDRLQAGDCVEVMRPAGVFCLRDREAPLVLFAAGSGITPVISILKSALATTQRRIRLVYANRDRDSVIFREEIEALARAHPDRFQLVARYDDEHGFIDADAVRAAVGDWHNADFYVCGPTPFMDTVEDTLHELAVDPQHIFIERFVSLSEAHPEALEALQTSGEAGALREPDDAAPRTLRVVLDGEEHEVPYRAGQTLLEAVRAADLEPPFACEEGYCSCCMAKLLAGRVRMIANDALDEDQVEEGWVLTCQGIPQSDDIKVEYPD